MYNFGNEAKQTLEQLSSNGVFFTVKANDKVNTMTIGWGSISEYWGEEIFVAPIRLSRYSYELLKDTDEFTVSVPAKGTMAEALKVCGTVSGRDGNKLAKADISLKNSEKLDTPLIDGCEIYYECKIVYRQKMDISNLNEEERQRWYADGNQHDLIFGKIIACHR